MAGLYNPRVAERNRGLPTGSMPTPGTTIPNRPAGTTVPVPATTGVTPAPAGSTMQSKIDAARKLIPGLAQTAAGGGGMSGPYAVSSGYGPGASTDWAA